MTRASRKATTQESVSSLSELFLQSFCPSLVFSLAGSANLSRAGCILKSFSGLFFFWFPGLFSLFWSRIGYLNNSHNQRKRKKSVLYLNMSGSNVFIKYKIH